MQPASAGIRSGDIKVSQSRRAAALPFTDNNFFARPAAALTVLA